MSYRTNRRTGGVFRTHDYTPSELDSQARRFTCPRCEAMLGHDISPAVAQMSARHTGHEIAGTPISSFLSRAELREHMRMVHGDQRFPTREQRALGRISINIKNHAETKTPTKKRATKKQITDLETMTEPETATAPETPDEGFMTEGATEAEGSGNQGFTDDDGQVFDGDGGLL